MSNKITCVKVIAFLGPPGSGKTTQCNLLQEKGLAQCISTSLLLREDAAKLANSSELFEKLNSGYHFSPSYCVDLIIKKLHTNSSTQLPFILDGSPRSCEEFDTLFFRFSTLGFKFTKIIEFKISEQKVMKRLMNRMRDDDRIDVIRERLNGYHTNIEVLKNKIECMPNYDIYSTLDASLSPRSVNEKLVTMLS